ncbi:MAG: hypothetical protein BGO12_21390 [Verrucomicrobia bacterium 61-8]|nr:MAG: hypothetical protein BGO12_21390 [Verrucomicrobia bacterium 61-8]
MAGNLASIWTASLLLGAIAPLAAQSPEIPSPKLPATYFDVLKLSDEELEKLDVARMNLLFAANLPGSESLDIEACLDQVNKMALYVRKRTEELRPKFEANSERFQNSEEFFKMTVLVTVLQKEAGVSYNPKFAIRPGEGYDAAAQVEMSKSSKYGFINGMLASEPRLGTCASMPVLFAAVGRRLGYPIRLVHAKNHLFARWHDDKVRFNVEPTEGVMVSPPDDKYTVWPFPLTKEQVENGPYLKSLSAKEEMVDAMNTRFWMLMRYKRHEEALGLALAVRKLLPDANKYLPLADAAAPLLYPPSMDGPQRSPYEPPNPMEGVMSSIMPNGQPGPSIDPMVLQALPPHARAAIEGKPIAPEFLPQNVRSAMEMAVPGSAPVMPDPLADLPPEIRQALPQPQR